MSNICLYQQKWPRSLKMAIFTRLHHVRQGFLPDFWSKDANHAWLESFLNITLVLDICYSHRQAMNVTQGQKFGFWLSQNKDGSLALYKKVAPNLIKFLKSTWKLSDFCNKIIFRAKFIIKIDKMFEKTFFKECHSLKIRQLSQVSLSLRN